MATECALSFCTQTLHSFVSSGELNETVIDTAVTWTPGSYEILSIDVTYDDLADTDERNLRRVVDADVGISLDTTIDSFSLTDHLPGIFRSDL